MHDACLVRCRERGRDLAPDVDGLTDRERSAALASLQILAVEPFHRDERSVFVDPPALELDRARAERSEGDDPHDARMVELGEDLAFAEKARLLGEPRRRSRR